MERYSLIHTKWPREFVLLQGTGCRWGKCTFCDYHQDASEQPFETNKQVLQQVTGQYGVLDVINSGSCVELDQETIELEFRLPHFIDTRAPSVYNGSNGYRIIYITEAYE